MKTLLMGIIAVLVTVFIPFRAQAQLPDSLPIGSRQKAYDWIVTNSQVLVNVSIRYTNTSGQYDPIGQGTVTRFDSYEHLKSVITPMAMNLLGIVRARSNVASTLRYYVLVRSYDSRDQVGLVIDRNIGYINNITVESFSNSSPSRGLMTMWVTNLSRVTVRSGSTLGVSDSQNVSNDLLMLDLEYCYGSEKMRVDLELSDGSQRTYTQFGKALTKPSVQILSSSQLIVSSCFGSDVTIVGSEDLKNWFTISTVSCIETNVFLLDISPAGQCKFFNAIAR